MGRGTDKSNLLADPDQLAARGVDLFEVERGGDITFHGPGQIVLYPIIDLRQRGRDLHRYLRDLELTVIDAVSRFGLSATTKQGLTGIWVEDHKIGAIGVAVSKWITYHGVALNVNTDLDFFQLINPCGITQYPVGSMSQLLNTTLDMEKVRGSLVSSFAEHFEYTPCSIGNLDAKLAEVHPQSSGPSPRT